MGCPGKGQSTATSQPIPENAMARRGPTGHRLVSVIRTFGRPEPLRSKCAMPSFIGSKLGAGLAKSALKPAAHGVPGSPPILPEASWQVFEQCAGQHTQHPRQSASGDQRCSPMIPQRNADLEPMTRNKRRVPEPDQLSESSAVDPGSENAIVRDPPDILSQQ